GAQSQDRRQGGRSAEEGSLLQARQGAEGADQPRGRRAADASRGIRIGPRRSLDWTISGAPGGWPTSPVGPAPGAVFFAPRSPTRTPPACPSTPPLPVSPPPPCSPTTPPP